MKKFKTQKKDNISKQTRLDIYYRDETDELLERVEEIAKRYFKGEVCFIKTKEREQ